MGLPLALVLATWPPASPFVPTRCRPFRGNAAPGIDASRPPGREAVAKGAAFGFTVRVDEHRAFTSGDRGTAMTDAALAAELAGAAGRLLLSVRAERRLDAGALGEAGDVAANRLLVEALRAARPGDGLLSEEMACDGVRLGRSRVWIVDPLDGTREYAEGRDDWAVHVALSIDGVAVIGAVALPASGRLFRSDRPEPPAPANTPPRLVVSRSRPPALARRVADELGMELVSMGSAGAKAMAVAAGDADAYLHLGGQNEWDSAAPVAVAAAHGLHCSRLDGSALRYNRPDVSLPDLLICRPGWASPILELAAGRYS